MCYLQKSCTVQEDEGDSIPGFQQYLTDINYQHYASVCGDNDINLVTATTTPDGFLELTFNYRNENFLQHTADGALVADQTFEDLRVDMGADCFFAVTGADVESRGSTGEWILDDQNNYRETCKRLHFRATINDAVAACGFSVDHTKSDVITDDDDVFVTTLSTVGTHTTQTTKVVRTDVVPGSYTRNFKIDIRMGTTVSVTTEDLAVFGFAINEFALTDSMFDPSIRAEALGEDVTTTFMTSVQWPYVMRSSDFVCTGSGASTWEQQTESRSSTSTGSAIAHLGGDARTSHAVGFALEVGSRASDCPETEGAVCIQYWEVVVARVDVCSSITPLELDAAYNADFDIGCRGSFTGTCVIPSGAGGVALAGEDQAGTGQERYASNFTTNAGTGGDGDAEQAAKNTVSWTSDSDNYCTRVLDEIPLEGEVAVFDTDFYDNEQSQFVFGSTAFVKVKVHARAEIAHIRVEKIQLNHQRGDDNNGVTPDPTTQVIYTDVHTDNADFLVGLTGPNPTTTFTNGANVDVTVGDTELSVRNDELTRGMSGVNDNHDDDDGDNEEKNEAQVTFDFLWNEHTSPAGSLNEDAATTTTITVDVRVQFKAAAPARRMRMLLQVPAAATPGVRSQAVVGVRGAQAEIENPVNAAPAKTTTGAFAALALALVVC
jgi:hypothetical protein